MEGDGFSILLVEDDPSLRLLCRVNLELEGFAVLEAGTLAEARAILDRADLVLLDLQVAREDGRTLLDEAKRIRPDRAVVLLTGSDFDPSTRALADDLVRKPFTPAELVASVRRAARVESPPDR
jgi:DNA-binding response OmpR family regulator